MIKYWCLLKKVSMINPLKKGGGMNVKKCKCVLRAQINRFFLYLDKPQLWLRLGQNLKEDQIKVDIICKNEIKYN